MKLNVFNSSASDGYFLVKVAEMPDLSVRVASLEDIPNTVRSAAAAATGLLPGEFDITTDY